MKEIMPTNPLTPMTWARSLKGTNDQSWPRNETYLYGLEFDKDIEFMINLFPQHTHTHAHTCTPLSSPHGHTDELYQTLKREIITILLSFTNYRRKVTLPNSDASVTLMRI